MVRKSYRKMIKILLKPEYLNTNKYNFVSFYKVMTYYYSMTNNNFLSIFYLKLKYSRKHSVYKIQEKIISNILIYY